MVETGYGRSTLAQGQYVEKTLDGSAKWIANNYIKSSYDKDTMKYLQQ
ncbi:MAG: hypothetical protein RSG52_04435 [Terrisporobacter sp.]